MIGDAASKSKFTVFVPKNVRKKPKHDPVEQEEAYVAYLRKQLDSENYKAAVTPEEYKKTKFKYDKAKLKLKYLKDTL